MTAAQGRPVQRPDACSWCGHAPHAAVCPAGDVVTHIARRGAAPLELKGPCQCQRGPRLVPAEAVAAAVAKCPPAGTVWLQNDGA